MRMRDFTIDLMMKREKTFKRLALRQSDRYNGKETS